MKQSSLLTRILFFSMPMLAGMTVAILAFIVQLQLNPMRGMSPILAGQIAGAGGSGLAWMYFVLNERKRYRLLVWLAVSGVVVQNAPHILFGPRDEVWIWMAFVSVVQFATGLTLASRHYFPE